MPNWVDNNLTIYGTKEQIEKVKRRLDTPFLIDLTNRKKFYIIGLHLKKRGNKYGRPYGNWFSDRTK